jgi:predicted acyl esterase
MRRLGFAVLLTLALAAPAQAASIDAHGSVEQVYATGLKAGTRYFLTDARDRVVKRKKADAQGGLLFRNVKPGSGYRVGGAGDRSEPLTVMTRSAEPADKKHYEQEIPTKGYGYMTMRDGIKLAYFVHPPEDVSTALGVDPPSVPRGPVPTLIEYSGYGYANPAGPNSGIAVLANLMGFAVVDINMRGTGCSGGAFDFFEPLQSIDGYDIVETVARQPWVMHNKVGMMGISYGGISQLFTAQLQPPSLAAISPLSVIDQTQTTLYPGGVLNTGFAVNWALERQHQAKPAGPKAGQEWAWKRIEEGDAVCKENQELHGQAANLLKKIRANDTYRPKVADPLSPVTFVDKIKVPTFMACQWTDEQTGGHCPTLAARMTGTNKKWFTYTNGTHVDSLAPETFNRWYDFLQIYVAQQAPMAGAAPYRAAGPVIYDAAMGVSNVMFPPDPIQEQPTYAGAKAAFEAQPSVRVLFDNGAGAEPGQPLPGFEHSFPAMPVPGAKARTWYFGPGHALADAPPAKTGADSFTWDSKARPLTNFTGDTGAGDNGLWTAMPPYKWLEPPAGTGVSYMTEPLKESTVVVGAGAVHVWMRASKPRVDLQATITEVRPDGKETFVQGGWLRGDLRKLDKAKSTPLEPVLSLRARDRQPVPRKRFVNATIPLYYQGHAYRAGSRIRVIITAPNGDQPIWSFTTRPKGKAKVTIGRGGKRASDLTLPVTPGVEVPTELPPCPALRGQPCRDFKG